MAKLATFLAGVFVGAVALPGMTWFLASVIAVLDAKANKAYWEDD